MGCKCAVKYDVDTGRYECSVTGDECIYLIPNHDSCVEDGYLDAEDELEEFELVDIDEDIDLANDDGAEQGFGLEHLLKRFVDAQEEANILYGKILSEMDDRGLLKDNRLSFSHTKEPYSWGKAVLEIINK